MTAERRDDVFRKDAMEGVFRLEGLNMESLQMIGFIRDNLDQHERRLKTQFSAWVRRQEDLAPSKAGITINDGDWIIHQFKNAEDKNGSRLVQNMMLVEEKCCQAKPSWSQNDTLWLLDQALTREDPKKKYRMARNHRVTNMEGNQITLRTYGVRLLRFDGYGPEDSQHIWWDRHEIKLEQLKDLLCFKLHPITLRHRDLSDRRHHSNEYSETPLFDTPLFSLFTDEAG